MESRDAYTRLNGVGDLEDVIRYGAFSDGHLCTMDARALDQYMLATDTLLVRFFQIDRLESGDVWRTHDEEVDTIEGDGIFGIRYLLRSDGRIGGTRFHGIQVVSSLGDREKNLSQLLGEDDENQKKASFLIRGAKEGETLRWPSARPGEHNSGPNPITLTYFRPEVLSKYKIDPDKYELTQSTVNCVGAWFLRSYGVNSEGQVHAYLKDLWNLPYSEQQYWASFNEEPRAGISEKSWMQDFERKRWDGHDALHELGEVLSRFPAPTLDGKASPIWSSEELGRPGDYSHVRLHQLLTESGEDWARHILDLNKIVVEGFDEGAIRRIALCDGLSKDELKGLRSLKLLERVLRKRKVEESVIETVCGPLREIQYWRSHGRVGHRGGERPDGDLRVHYKDLIERTYQSMELLASLINAGTLDVNEANASAA